jgi:hypothetical protein
MNDAAEVWAHRGGSVQSPGLVAIDRQLLTAVSNNSPFPRPNLIFGSGFSRRDIVNVLLGHVEVLANILCS